MKEVIKKQLENTPNGKDDEKTQNDRINTTNFFQHKVIFEVIAEVSRV